MAVVVLQADRTGQFDQGDVVALISRGVVGVESELADPVIGSRVAVG